MSHINYTNEQIREALSFLNSPDDYEYQKWLQVGMALKDGGYPVELWCEWSMKDPSDKYSEDVCQKKWNSFKGQGVTMGTLIKRARDKGWSYIPNVMKDVDKPRNGSDSFKDVLTYVVTLFQPGDLISIDTGLYMKNGRMNATAGKLFTYEKLYADLLRYYNTGDLRKVIGNYPDLGVLVRFNPMDCEGSLAFNVTDYRYCLIESDKGTIEEQYKKIMALQLPVKVLVYSGNKSLHAIVKISASDKKEYDDRVRKTYEICESKGFVIDHSNSNANKYSRLPGVMRNGKQQKIIQTDIGLNTWEEWYQKNRDLSEFHTFNKGKITGVYDKQIYREIVSNNEIFILGKVPYFYKAGVYKQDLNGTKIKNEIQKLVYDHLYRSNIGKRIYELFIDSDELQASDEDLNQQPKEWINFRNGYYDPISKSMKPHNPDYLTTNQIPYDFIPEAKLKGDNVDRWLSFALPDPDDREMFLEYVGYCMTTDTRQQKFLILKGEGGNGKSIFLSMASQAVGSENTSSISMDKISNDRFASSGLKDKLLNVCGDLKTTAIPDVSVLKQVTGEDLIRMEQKGKDAFFFKPYAKLMFSANELPQVQNESTRGFFRRCLILPVDRKPKRERKGFLETLEIDYFIHLAVKALERMYEQGTILESDHSKEAVKQYRIDSDTVQAFLEECEKIKFLEGVRANRTHLYETYQNYCAETGRVPVNPSSKFFKALEDKGYKQKKSNGYHYFLGIQNDDSRP